MALINKLNAIGDAVRVKTGITKKLSLDEIAEAILSIKSLFSGQHKAVTPTTTEQTVVADSDYDGLSSVTVSAVETETTNITENGTYTPTSGKFFNQVIVDVASGIDEAVLDEIHTRLQSSIGGE